MRVLDDLDRLLDGQPLARCIEYLNVVVAQAGREAQYAERHVFDDGVLVELGGDSVPDLAVGRDRDEEDFTGCLPPIMCEVLDRDDGSGAVHCVGLLPRACDLSPFTWLLTAF